MDTLQKIERISRFMQMTALAFIVVLPLYHVLAWFAVDSLLQSQLAHRGIHVPVGAPAGAYRLPGFLVQALPLALLVGVLFRMYGLFEGYRRGEVFTLSAVARFQGMARLLFTFTAVNPLAGALLSVIVTSGQPGQRMLVIGFGGPEIAALVMGGMLLAMGRVMVEARCLADDNSQIV